MNTLHIVKFRNLACILTAAVCILANLFWMKKKKAVIESRRSLVLTEECLFLALFLLWTYLAGFRPEAYGTEKFMDYGFMATMMRGDYMPAEDLWYAGEQLIIITAASTTPSFLPVLPLPGIQETSHLMRTMVAVFAFVLPFSLVRQMLEDRWKERKRGLAAAGGVLAGTAVSLAGKYALCAVWKTDPLDPGDFPDSF